MGNSNALSAESWSINGGGDQILANLEKLFWPGIEIVGVKILWKCFWRKCLGQRMRVTSKDESIHEVAPTVAVWNREPFMRIKKKTTTPGCS